MRYALFFVGAFLCFPYIFTSFGPAIMAGLALAWTGVSVAARLAPWRFARWIAATCSGAAYGVSMYGAVLVLTVLGWSLPVWSIAMIMVAAVAALVTARRGWTGIRVPLVLPLGLLITTTLLGWWREGGRVRCDDFLRAQQQSDVAVMIPSLRTLPACQPGAMLPLHRYPRHVWEADDEKTFLFTTQKEPFAGETEDGFDGAVCSARPDQDRRRCFGSGKGEHVLEVAPDRVIVMSREGDGGVLYVLQRNDVFGDPATVMVGRAGTGFYDRTLDMLYVVGDDGTLMTPVRGSDLTPEAGVPIRAMLADSSHYDDVRHTGMLCGGAGPIGALLNGGHSFLATRFHATPLGLTPIGDSLLAWFGVSFGCDWDPESGRVFVALPNLGAVADVDFETGRLLGIGPAEIGLRMLRFDARRQRIYAGNFLRGFVVELDAASKRQLRRWFVGRFARDIRVTRNGRSLLVASNLGIVRISL